MDHYGWARRREYFQNMLKTGSSYKIFRKVHIHTFQDQHSRFSNNKHLIRDASYQCVLLTTMRSAGRTEPGPPCRSLSSTPSTFPLDSPQSKHASRALKVPMPKKDTNNSLSAVDPEQCVLVKYPVQDDRVGCHTRMRARRIAIDQPDSENLILSRDNQKSVTFIPIHMRLYMYVCFIGVCL